jgi:glutamate/tyrosine decarboxylase-like PLP-dependent enzyme
LIALDRAQFRLTGNSAPPLHRHFRFTQVETSNAALREAAPLELDAATMHTMARQVADLVVEHLASIGEQPAQRSLSRAETERTLLTAAPEAGEPLDAILRGLREKVIPFHAREPSPRFVGYVPSCPTFAGVLGDWIGAGFNFFSGVWSVAAGPNQVELTVLDWFRTWLGMPPGTSGLLTSGGSSATLTAIVAARHRAAGEECTLLPRLTMYTSEQAHSSVARAGWIAGIPRANVRAVATDESFRMRADALAEAIRADRAAGYEPFLVAASAGTTNTGAVDPLDAVADLCAAEALWMHVDAAYAGFATLTPAGAAAMRGIERADSVTLDPHKWLFVPFECGCLLARDPAALEAAFSTHPEYLNDVRAVDQDVNFADYGEQLTRGPRALKVWLSVRYYGVAAIRDTIARGMALAEYMEARLRELPEFEILSPAQFGVLCFRLRGSGTLDDVNALNMRVNAAVNGTGRFLMSSTVLRGAYSLRVCTHGFRTTADDLDALIAAIRAEIRG